MNVRGERESQMLHRRRALCHNMREEGLEKGEAHPPARPAGKWAAQPCNGHCHSTSTEQGGGIDGRPVAVQPEVQSFQINNSDVLQ